ncbi:Wadjet anti-phage system protein JetA family protein [Ruegeria sp. HKCCE4150]|uniref:Wadjet anti-phage system protein JetA family protein n=1 Tax=Ruegeria sp. HKCCE4150 TaxID=2794828 RepID=UPI001AE4D71C|nr:Wadjet anti-phage system protein JetA family protein [Ruegeria sp. HKCCE4150]
MVNAIFGSLEPSQFRLFSTENAMFYADLVEHLATEVFRYAAETMRKKQVQRAIEDFILAREWQASLTGEECLRDGPVHYAVYSHLVKSKWLEESRDGLRTVVDLNSEARLLLQALLDIKSGKVRSFGGEVLQVKTLVDAVRRDPESASENLTWAGAHAQRFMTNLRAIVGAFRKVEQSMKGQSSVAGMMDTFFHNYITDNYIADYRKLRGENSPYRFRHDLVEDVRAMMEDAVLVNVLATAFVREGRAPSLEEAEHNIISSLSTISDVFSSIDSHIDMIEANNSRIERRVLNINRFLSRMGDDQTGQYIDAAKRLGRSKLASNSQFPVNYDVLDVHAHFDRGSIHKSRPPRKAPPPVVARKRLKDPALVAYEAAKRHYIDRIRVNPERVRSFLDTKMGQKISIRASDIEIVSLDEFFIFERLMIIKTIFPDDLNDVEITRLPTSLENEWISCSDFEIKKRAETLEISK